MEFKRKRDKISDNVGKTIMMLFVLVIVGYIFPFRYALYCLPISIVIIFIRNNLRFTFSKLIYIKLFSTFVFVYLLFLLTISISPYLKIQEFKWSHPSWKKKEVEILDLEPHHFRGFKSNGHAFVEICFQSRTNGKEYNHIQQYTLKRYFPFWDKRSTSQKKQETLLIAEKMLVEKSYSCLVNSKNPNQAILFLPISYIDLRSSVFYQVLSSFTILAALFFIFASILIYLLTIRMAKHKASEKLYEKLLRKKEIS
ncbi:MULTISPECIES: hypothetical protein [Sphingobacterium]|uniref:DUF4131 domain-containing protein n=1 Tax=Sphingobacterium tenebrionis TaxID=3111775 RepID=A0ABU8I281_9SPHI|nr:MULTISPECIES: hypothetical protein [unclassified Sphingobacterium]QBR11701.1 hypothetical protein E3D81_05740 [Sphingobacterium sp. CZ-2]